MKEAAITEALGRQSEAYKVELQEANERANMEASAAHLEAENARRKHAELEDAHNHVAERAESMATEEVAEKDRLLQVQIAAVAEEQSKVDELRQRLGERNDLLASAVNAVERVGSEIAAEKRDRISRPSRKQRIDGARRAWSKSRQVKSGNCPSAWQPFGEIPENAIWRPEADAAAGGTARDSPINATSDRAVSPNPDGLVDGQLGQVLGEVAALEHELQNRSRTEITPPNVGGGRRGLGPPRAAWT